MRDISQNRAWGWGGGGQNITLLEGSQASSARPSGKEYYKMKVNKAEDIQKGFDILTIGFKWGR